MIITKETLEQSIKENEDFMEMVCEKKYGNKDKEKVIWNVIKKCNITDEKQQKLLLDGYFIPAGSILSACNLDKNVSLSNCYLTKIENDSIEAIFDAQKKMARTYSYRGGTGYDITVLRPKESKVNNAAITSSGSVSFLPSFSMVTKTIGQHGRRGASLGSIDIRHPDSLDFIWCKANPEKVFENDIFSGKMPDIDGSNLSLKLTNDFMKAVKNNQDWTFYFPDFENQKELYDEKWDGDYDKWKEIGGKFKEYKTMPAKEVLRQIAEASHSCGDPGILFIDKIQQNTFGTFIHVSLKPMSCNPCAEQPLAYYSNCLLGALVLHKYVINAFKQDSHFDFAKFNADVQIATKILNIFSDLNVDRHPLKEQRDADKFGKRIGLEITGLGDCLAMLGYEYKDSLNNKEATKTLAFIEEIGFNMLDESINQSIKLAKENGACPALFSIEARENLILNSFFDFSDKQKENIMLYGLANTAFVNVGPCGTISILSDNCTSGIEPLYKFAYKRKNRVDNKEYTFIHYLACKHMLDNLDEFKGLTLEEAKNKLNYFEANEIKNIDRIKIQSTLQKNIDSSISSTINLSNDATVDEIYNIYLQAYENDLKGVTIFRDGSKISVLSSVEDKKETSKSNFEIFEKELLDIETSERHRVMWKKSKLYVNVSKDDNTIPIEIFAKLPKEVGINGDGLFNPVLWQERTSNWDLICRLISMLFRYGIPLEEIILQLDKSTYSLVDAAGILKRILSKYVSIDYEENEDGEIIGEKCPECGQNSYIKENGCGKCLNCGTSSCG